MEALVQERIKRFHGDFLDDEGEYEVVSSLISHNKHQQKILNSHLLGDATTRKNNVIQQEHVIATSTSGSLPEQLTATGHEYFLYFKMIWSVLLLVFIAWITMRWLDHSSPWKNNEKEGEIKSTNNSKSKSWSEGMSSTSSKEEGCTRATAKAFRCGNNLSL